MSSEVLRSSPSRTITYPSYSILNACKHIVANWVEVVGVNNITYKMSMNIDRKQSAVCNILLEPKGGAGGRHVTFLQNLTV